MIVARCGRRGSGKKEENTVKMCRKNKQKGKQNRQNIVYL